MKIPHNLHVRGLSLMLSNHAPVVNQDNQFKLIIIIAYNTNVILSAHWFKIWPVKSQVL